MNPSYRRVFVVAVLFAFGVACCRLAVVSSAQEKGSAPEKQDKGKDQDKEKGKGNEKDKEGGGRVATAPPRWEYKVTSLARQDEVAEKQLNELSDEGWELVATPTNEKQSRMIFRRPKK